MAVMITMVINIVDSRSALLGASHVVSHGVFT